VSAAISVGVFTAHLLVMTGATKPAVLQILAGPDRYQLYQQLIRWCGTGKAAQSRVVSVK
jgi:hypothetical protein